MVEGASLESLYMGNCIVGSNPILSAILNPQEIQFCNSWGFVVFVRYFLNNQHKTGIIKLKSVSFLILFDNFVVFYKRN